MEHLILLRQALLSIGDYTLPVDNYHTLCSDHTDGSGYYSLKYLFSQCEKITTDLLDMIKDNSSDIRTVLEGIINDSKVSTTDWRYCLIKYHELFECMQQSAYRLLKKTDGQVLLLKTAKRSSGANTEIFMGALECALKEKKAT